MSFLILYFGSMIIIINYIKNKLVEMKDCKDQYRSYACEDDKFTIKFMLIAMFIPLLNLFIALVLIVYTIFDTVYDSAYYYYKKLNRSLDKFIFYLSDKLAKDK